MTVHRLGRIFGPDERSVIIALDHGLIDGPCPGLLDPGPVLREVVAGGADAVLTSFGVARRFERELAPIGLILRSDGSTTSLAGPSTGSVGTFVDVEQALRLGADAVVVSAMPGSPTEADTLTTLARTIADAHRWGLPVLAEMVPGGFDSPAELRTTESVAFAARLGAELGADFVKAPYCPDYERVVERTYVPVVILGGSKGSEAALLADIRAAVDAGAAGVAIGRNVFQAEHPAAMTAAIVAVVHHDASVDDALALLE